MDLVRSATVTVKVVVFPLSLSALFLYPVALSAWIVLKGRSAARLQSKAQESEQLQESGLTNEEATKNTRSGGSRRRTTARGRGSLLASLIALALACLVWTVAARTFSHLAGGSTRPGGRAGLTRMHQMISTSAPAEISLWHDVDLHVKTWLDEGTGLFHYVNEIPLGGLSKHEVQPREPYNRIVEDSTGSARLQAFGKPVPFNYGCFPQTYRDPEEVDELHGAPGDDDPLDVLDVSGHNVDVGAVAECRILGAVCLVDEGEADWKVFVVNTKPGPLADAKSVEDVERVAPGRIKEMLRWMEEFKHSTGKDTATLHYKIHDAEWATALVERDHAAWRRLLTEAGSDGKARGHWIRPAGPVEAHWGRQFARLLSARIPKVAKALNRTASWDLIAAPVSM